MKINGPYDSKPFRAEYSIQWCDNSKNINDFLTDAIR
jgi:hypothetical protein